MPVNVEIGRRQTLWLAEWFDALDRATEATADEAERYLATCSRLKRLGATRSRGAADQIAAAFASPGQTEHTSRVDCDDG